MQKSYVINDAVIFYPDEHRLVKKDDPSVDILLNIPASRCLALLIEREGDLITQKEFFAEVWESQGTYVTQNTFYQNISLLRKALKSAGLVDNPIKTVLKRGMTLAETINVTTLEDPSQVASMEKNFPDRPPSIKNTWLIPVTLKIKWLYLLLLALFTLFSLGYYQEKQSNIDLFASYKRYGEINDCQIMIPDEVATTDIYTSFLKSKPISCQGKSIVYLTADREVPHISMIQCTQDIHSQAAKCHSSSYARD